MRTSSAQLRVAAIMLLLPALTPFALRWGYAQDGRPTAVQGQAPEQAAPAQPTNAGCASLAANAGDSSSGWQNCHFCHRGGGNAAADEKDQLNILVQLNESPIWLRDDKHAIAAKVLCPDKEQKNLAYFMQQVLGEQRYQTLVQSHCSACHVAGEPQAAARPASDDCAVELEHTFGVTCEACHGPAKEWVHKHWEERKTWRYLSPAEKSEAGFVNLRDPVTKTRKCLSCHLGSVPEGKIVTHEMYAAGHPPLAGFEVGTYSQAMPAHWTGVHTKTDAQYKALHRAQGVFAPQTREVLLGGLVALESNLRMLADYAAAEGAQGHWPEFALYDCFACHHDLQAPTRRPLPNPALGKPGRPSLSLWPSVAARLAIEETSGAAEIDAALNALIAALGEQPFGQRERVQAAAHAAAELVCQRIAVLKTHLDRSHLPEEDARRLERELVERVLGGLGQPAARESHDYDSARQLVWAFDRVYQDYKALNGQVENSDSIAEAFSRLQSAELRFGLTQGQQPIGEPRTLARLFAARRVYDPRQFQEQLTTLRRLLDRGNRGAP